MAVSFGKEAGTVIMVIRRLGHQEVDISATGHQVQKQMLIPW